MVIKSTHPEEPAQSKSNPFREEPRQKYLDTESKDEKDFLETELRLTLEEVARLHNSLADANMKLAAFQKHYLVNNSLQKTEPPLFSELLEELTPSLTTITNYTELLNSQTVGPLGPLQLRFVERISRSIEQIRKTIEEYKSKVAPQILYSAEEHNHISLPDIIQQSIDHKSAELREKQITLQLSMPDSLPEVMGSIEEATQIVDIVINNALQVTPLQEIVSISLSWENVDHSDFVMLKISDCGAGIPVKLLPNLLSIHGEQQIPGCSLSRSGLIALNQLIQDQGAIMAIENGESSGCVIKIYFLPARSE